MNPILNLSLLIAAGAIALIRLDPLTADAATTTRSEAPRASVCRDTGVVVRGSWICEKSDCAFLERTHGQPFRSAAPQDCPHCGQGMVR